MAEYLPIGIHPILNVPSGWTGMPNDSPFSWNSFSCTFSPSGNVTGLPSWTTLPLNASTVGPSKGLLGPHPAAVSPTTASTEGYRESVRMIITRSWKSGWPPPGPPVPGAGQPGRC